MKDVLIFEDDPEQVRKITDWLGLPQFQYEFCKRFAEATPGRRKPPAEAETGWRWVRDEIARVKPKVVIFDYLLAKDHGAESYDGLDYGKRSKTEWPQLGVVLVTTGGNYVSSQAELDEIRNNTAPPEGLPLIDAAWIKPWGNESNAISETEAQVELQRLVARSRRPE